MHDPLLTDQRMQSTYKVVNPCLKNASPPTLVDEHPLHLDLHGLLRRVVHLTRQLVITIIAITLASSRCCCLGLAATLGLGSTVSTCDVSRAAAAAANMAAGPSGAATPSAFNI
jgi:hypothetical protein